MAAGNWTFTNGARTRMLNGTFDFDTDTFKMALFLQASNLGDYAALFTVGFDRGQVKTHRVLFSILPRGVPLGMEDMPVLNLRKTACEHEVEEAIGQSLRKARKSGKSIKEVYDTAQQKLGKRIAK